MSFREISMIKIEILHQSKPILLYLKIKNPKFKNTKFVIEHLLFIKKLNKRSTQPILKSNSMSFMFNNIFCEIKGKKVIHSGGRGRINETSKFLLGMEFQYLLGYPRNNYTFMPYIGSLCVGFFYWLFFLSYNCSPEKWHFRSLKSLLLPQFSTYRHRIWFIMKRE